MGRLPKGFKKTMQPHAAGPEEDAPASSAPPAAAEEKKPAQRKSQEGPSSRFLAEPAAASKNAPAAADSTANADEEEEGASSSGVESRGHMLQRHKREMLAWKKNLPRLGKKSKDEIAKLTAELEAKHAKELADLDTATSSAAAAPAEARAAAAVATKLGAMAVAAEDDDGEGTAPGGGKHMTKAMKRRAKHAAEEAERAARIAAEAEAAGPSARLLEEQALAELLIPLGLRMRDIRADGHCLYRSIEDQLRLVTPPPAASEGAGEASSAVPDYQALREQTAAHIRAHPEEYLHFMDVHDGEEPAAALDRYCTELATTAVWGGQLELSVLAQVLRRPIKVLAVDLPPLTLGEQFNGSTPPLQVCYLRHAFGLGEHYNSVEAVPPAPAA